MIFSSTSEILSIWFLKLVAMIFLFLLSFFLFFGFRSRCNFQHFSYVFPSKFQWLLGSLYCCVVAGIFLSFTPFRFFFPSLEASYCSFCFNPLDCTLFRPMFSRYYACTQASSIDLGLNNINFSHRWWCISPKYLRSTSGFLGEIPNIIAIFLPLWPDFCLK